jgi:riboflavin kinase/FMN adenylyltransferase
VKVYHDLPPGPGDFSRPAVTIGNFDGVHLGHRAILARLIDAARKLEAPAVALTFEPHPLKVVRPDLDMPLLTTPEQKLRLLEAAGVDAVVVLPFSPEFAAIPARAFVTDYFTGRLQAREVVVGYDYCFGRGREGNIALLKEMGPEAGFSVQVAEAEEVDGAVVSSSLIRALLRLGKVAEAARLLGRDYEVVGKVVPGHGRGGKLLGVPTANLKPENELLPAMGIYAVRAKMGPALLPGVANIGTCPTFENGGLSLEVHLLDFNGDLYGAEMAVEFAARLREERRFPSIDALAEQIHKDIANARRALAG